jgi:hypothetical protein
VDATTSPKAGRGRATRDSGSKNENLGASAIAQISLNDNKGPLVDQELRRYFLVGTCYVNGIMDGEVLDENLEVEEILLC